MSVEYSVVVPVCNEAENVEPLAREIEAALQGRAYEMLFVDDGSTDDTATILCSSRRRMPALRVMRHSFRSGQSAAVASGVRAARAQVDRDARRRWPERSRRHPQTHRGARLGPRTAACCCSWAIAAPPARTRRSASCSRASRTACARAMLGDGTPDTGCGIKLFVRDTFMELPHFDHMHRFLPALFQRHGARVISVPVSHRPRARGTSKYGMLESPLGRHRRHPGRDVAATPLQVRPAGPRRMNQVNKRSFP